MIKHFVKFEKAKKIIDFLTQIPNLKLCLTYEQKKILRDEQATIALGRSGTGKTTCAILKLFAVELLFKMEFALAKKKDLEEENQTVDDQDIDNNFGLRCIFMTASPVLTNEIQRYYKKMTNNIKKELVKKK